MEIIFDDFVCLFLLSFILFFLYFELTFNSQLDFPQLNLYSVIPTSQRGTMHLIGQKKGEQSQRMWESGVEVPQDLISEECAVM